MTMIAIALKGDTAEFMTDSASYIPNGRSFGRTTKSHPLPHLNMAVLSQGDGEFGDLVANLAYAMASRALTFGQVLEAAPMWLREGWKARQARLPEGADDGMQDATSTAFLVGYDEQRGKFRAFLYPSEDDFEPTEIKSGTFVYPSLWGYRPSKMELGRLRTVGHGTEAEREEVARIWQAKPPLRAARTVAEWTELAKGVRTQRALTGFCKVLVAGSVYLTRLSVGSVQTEKIHEYNDSGDEFRQMVAGTAHPIGQLGPCDCGSGKTFRDCCFDAYHDERGNLCSCGSGALWPECCRIPDAADQPAAAS